MHGFPQVENEAQQQSNEHNSGTSVYPKHQNALQLAVCSAAKRLQVDPEHSSLQEAVLQLQRQQTKEVLLGLVPERLEAETAQEGEQKGHQIHEET